MSVSVPSETLQTFTLADLAPYATEGAFSADDSPDSRLFLVGRDDVFGVLMHLYTRVTLSIESTMFGFDSDELNGVIWSKVEDPNVVVEQVLDSSQAGGVHEKKILAADATSDPEKYAADFVIMRSDSGQIVHSKGAVLDGVVGYEGSTNWSASGMGQGIGLHGAANVTGFKAQENTLLVFTNRVMIAKLSARIRYTAISGRARNAAKVAALAATPALPGV
jgi:hypothetical protein